ncbi:DUF4787 domain-containing protein [archaeon]|nr:MAG: DUF4787 domain-containing protein [archaeon]
MVVPSPARGVLQACTCVDMLLPRCLVYLACFTLCGWALPAARRRVSSEGVAWAGVRSSCSLSVCAAIPALEREVCIAYCTSPACYQVVYGEDALLPGEVDPRREKAYRSCLQRVAKARKRGGRWPPLLLQQEGHTDEPDDIL